MKLPLSVIAQKLGKPLATIRSAAGRGVFPTSKLGSQRVADLEQVRAYFATSKAGRPKR